MRRLVMIDTETGGLDAAIHGLTEVGAVAFDLAPDGALWERETFHCLLRPAPLLSYTPYALNLQGQTLESLTEHGQNEFLAYPEFAAFLLRHVGKTDARAGQIWAHNAVFDHAFIAAFAHRATGLKHDFPARCDWSCTKTLFYILRSLGVHDGQWSNLKSMAELFGVEFNGRHHTAVTDAVAAMRCLAAMTRLWHELSRTQEATK